MKCLINMDFLMKYCEYNVTFTLRAKATHNFSYREHLIFLD